MNIIQIKTTNSSVTIPKREFNDYIPSDIPPIYSQRIPFNYFYLAKNGEIHKTLLRSYELIFELILTRQLAVDLLCTPWDKERSTFNPNHPVNEIIINNILNIEEWSLYIPIYNFYRIDNTIKNLGYLPPFRSLYPESVNLKVHLPKQSFPNPCLLCENFPNHQAGECALLQPTRPGYSCPASMKLHVPRRLL